MSKKIDTITEDNLEDVLTHLEEEGVLRIKAKKINLSVLDEIVKLLNKDLSVRITEDTFNKVAYIENNLETFVILENCEIVNDYE
jgi:hypothetical protein